MNTPSIEGMQVADGIEQLYFVTAFLSGRGIRLGTGESVSWVGTGFIYRVDTDKGQANFLVSNKHVIDGDPDVTPLELDVRLVAANDQGEPAFGATTSVTIRRQPGDVDRHPDPATDVAAIPFQFIHNAMREAGSEPFFRAIGEDITLSPERVADEVRALEDVVFVGYPSGIYDNSNFTPIVRRGITATPIALDYQGAPTYLIDAAVFEGSSGSPVFIYGIPPPPKGAQTFWSGGTRILFAGLLASGHYRQQRGTVVSVPTAWAAVTREMLGLGIVFKPWTIDACIDARLQAAGLTRMSEAAPSAGADSSADHELGETMPVPELAEPDSGQPDSEEDGAPGQGAST